MSINRKLFFAGVKDRIDPTLTQSQVDGLNSLLDNFEKDQSPVWKDKRCVAYALATAFHETAGSFQPVEEGYYLGKKAKSFQKTLRYYPYYGRGYVQLTWPENYKKAGKAFGVDLENHPEKALEPNIAYKALTVGLERGWYGGKLTTYINADKTDYVNARRCVNKLDKAGLIAGYAKSFEKILNSAAVPATTNNKGASQATPPNSDPPVEQPPIPTPPEEAGQTVVSVPPVQTEVDTSLINRIQTWKAALPPFLLSVGSGVWAWIQGASTEIIVSFFGAAAAVAIAFLYFNYRSRENEKNRKHEEAETQKARDFELTKLQLLSAMDPTKQTVRLVPPPTQIPESPEITEEDKLNA